MSDDDLRSPALDEPAPSGPAQNLLASVTDPVGGMLVGILATVLVQSSSVSTATIGGCCTTTGTASTPPPPR